MENRIKELKKAQEKKDVTLIDKVGHTDEGLKEINIPGQKQKIDVAKKPPMIVEMKDVPEVAESNDGLKLALVIHVEKESSAKAIDLDVSQTELKLKSEHYALSYKFKVKVADESVQAKFSKAKRTLTLTFDLI